MKIDYDGQQYLFEFDDVTIQQGLAIEKFMGCSFDEWGKKLQEGDLRSRQVLGWLILSGGDLTVPVEDTDFKMVPLGKAIADAFEAEEARLKAEAAPVPTAAAASNGHAPAAALSLPSSPPSSDVISR